MRLHGFQRPFSIWQIISWIYSGFCVSTFYLIILPSLLPEVSLSIGFFFSISTANVITFAWLCTSCDPTDKAIYKYIISVNNKQKINSSNFESSKYPKICKACKFRVHQDAKHCGQCNRCVKGFDHHCKWLNNCIGKDNYRLFVGLISNLFTLAIIQLFSSLYLFALVYQEQEQIDKLKDFYGFEFQNFSNIILGLLAFIAFLDFLLILANGQLIVLHIWLYYKDMTTYQFILMIREKKRQKNYRKRVQKQMQSLEEEAKDSIKEQYEPYIHYPVINDTTQNISKSDIIQ